ncbi:MAG: polymer-forming cytoskeletal protein [candidate division Zixibacteria bacterium]|nr:polymer-forming cytoskeletal protein [Candidatus Tariuqbacter arcticus]
MRLRALFLSLFILTLISTAHSALLKTDDWVSVEKERDIRGDLYAFGRQVDISGVIKGDLITSAQHIFIDGTVTQNLYAAAQNIRITGEIAHDFWGFAQTIELNGKIEGGFRGACAELLINCPVNGDIIVGAGKVIVAPKAVVRGNLYVGAGELEIKGEVYGEVIGGVQEFKLSGLIAGDVDLCVEEIVFKPSGKVDGDFNYKSAEPLEPEFRSQVTGEITFEAVDKKHKAVGFCVWVKILMFLAAIVTAFIIIAFFTGRLRENFDTFADQPWKTLLIGFLGLIVIPVIVLIAFITLIGIPLGLTIAALYVVFLYLAWVIAGILLGRLIIQLLGAVEPSLLLSALLGIAVLSLLGLIPFIGGLFCFAAVLFGLGIILIGLYDIFWGRG